VLKGTTDHELNCVLQPPSFSLLEALNMLLSEIIQVSAEEIHAMDHTESSRVEGTAVSACQGSWQEAHSKLGSEWPPFPLKNSKKRNVIKLDRQEKLPSVEVRLKRLKSTEGFSTCCAIAQLLISTL
jgi:hypothetical protein